MVTALLALAAGAALAGPVTISDLLAVTDIAALTVSPDGRVLAFRTEQLSLPNSRIETRWWTVPVDGHAAARLLAEGGEALLGGAGVVGPEKAQWSADARQLLVRSAGNDGVQVRAIDVATGRVRSVTRAAGDVTTFAISPDGTAVDYAEGPSRARIGATEQRLRDEGARVDDSVDLTVGVTGGAWALGRPRSVRLTGDWFDRRGLVDGAPQGWRQPLAGGAPTPIADAPQWPVYVAPEPATKARVCALLDCDMLRIDTVAPVPALQAHLVTTRGAEPQQRLQLLDASGVRAVFSADGLASGSRQQTDPCAVAGQRALCVLAAADAPPRLAAIDLATGQMTMLFAPNKTLAERVRGAAERFSWRDGGHMFVGQLFVPRRDRPAAGFPLVIQYYWCDGFLRGGQGDELPMAPLAAHGIAVLCINKQPAGAGAPDHVTEYRVAASGIAAAIDQLAARGVIDRGRVGMQGLSFGSQVTMWVASHTGLLRAAAIASGQVEPATYWFEARPGNNVATRLKEDWRLDDPDRFPEGWRAKAPAKLVDRIRAPLLMQLPESEARWSIELYAKLRHSPTPVELYAFPDAAHVKALPRQKAAAYERNLAWFRFWLQGVTQVDPGDLDRAGRWQAFTARRPHATDASQNSTSASSSNRM